MIERAVLEKLGAGCHEPIGVLADMGSEDTLDLRLMTVINEQLIYRQMEGKKTEWEDMINKICKCFFVTDCLCHRVCLCLLFRLYCNDCLSCCRQHFVDCKITIFQIRFL